MQGKSREKAEGGFELMENGTVRFLSYPIAEEKRLRPDKEEEYYGFRRDRAASAESSSRSTTSAKQKKRDSDG